MLKRIYKHILLLLFSSCPFLDVSAATYNYTGNVQNILIPQGVTNIYCEIVGASGAGSSPGLGAVVKGYLTVQSGQTLNLYVGGTNGYNGGGSSGIASGGGATDIRINGTNLNNRVIVAGGGGGYWNGRCKWRQ
jgi:hypothetical protein